MSIIRPQVPDSEVSREDAAAAAGSRGSREMAPASTTSNVSNDGTPAAATSDASHEIAPTAKPSDAARKITPAATMAAELSAEWLDTAPSRSRRFGPKSMSFLLLSVIPTVLFALYLYLIAADQFVSVFRFTIQHSQPVMSDGRGDLGGVSSQALLFLAVAESESAVGYIKSRQIIDDLPGEIDLERIFATSRADWWWRLDENAPVEEVLRHWKRMVEPVFDLTSGIVSVEVRAFSPEEAERLAVAVHECTERMVNAVSHRLRKDAEDYARRLVEEAEGRLRKAELALRDFRNSNTVLLPDITASISAKLETDLRDEIAQTQAQIELFRLQGVPQTAPRVVVLSNRLDALRRELDQQMARMTQDGPGVQVSGRPLASAMSDYDALQTEVKIASTFYEGTIESLALARARVEQQGVYLATFVKPARPETSIFPRRARWLGIFFVSSVFLWALVLLFGYSIRDHMH